MTPVESKSNHDNISSKSINVTASTLQIGQRIATLDGRLGIVRYIGPITNNTLTTSVPAVWIGVDWDNSADGKHDGSVNNINYFSTRTSTSGSFIRPTQINCSRSLLDAVYKKYFSDQTTTTDQHSQENTSTTTQQNDQVIGVNRKGDEIRATTWASTKIGVEMYGFDKVHRKQTQLNQLNEVNLAGLCINFINPAVELIQNNFVNIIELDLSRNLIDTWHHLAEIGKAAPRLFLLRLNHNRFKPIDNTDNISLRDAFPCVTILSLNGVMLPFQQVVSLIVHFPALKELYLGFNEYTHLASTSTDLILPSVEVVSVESNQLDWDAIQDLRIFHGLKSLIAANNKITTIKALPDTDDHGCFMLLEKLYLQDNLLSQWTCVDVLNKLSALRELRINKNPLYKVSNGYSRLQAIGRLQYITSLNGSLITKKDRLNAEVYYLKNIFDENLQKTGRTVALSTAVDELSNAMDPNVVSQHASLQRLANTHGIPLVTAIADERLVSQLIELTLVCQKSQKPNVSQVKKKVTPNMTVRMLKSFACRTFGLRKCQLRSQRKDGSGQHMTDELQQVLYYDVVSGDIVDVQCND